MLQALFRDVCARLWRQGCTRDDGVGEEGEHGAGAGSPPRLDEDEDELELELEQILNESDHETEGVGLPEVPTQNVEDLLDKLCISPLKVETSEKPALRPQMAMS